MARKDFCALQGEIRKLDQRLDTLQTHLDGKIDAARREVAELIRTGFEGLRDEHQEQRREIVDATGNGFAEQRAALGQIGDRLAQVRTDVGEVLRELERMRREAAEARVAVLEAERRQQEAHGGPPSPPAGTGSAADGGDGGDADDYEDLLELAAGVAYAEIACHRDTWSFLVERAAQTEHFRLPADVDEDRDGTIETDISGRSLIATIDALWHTQTSPGTSAGTRALAAEIYRRISEALQELSPAGAGDQPVTRIVIDNRPSDGGTVADADEATPPETGPGLT